MIASKSLLQEENVSNAFSRQASKFDDVDIQNPVIQRMRKQVHTQLLSLLKPNDRILELNCGTGIDAIFLAQQGFNIVATDNAQGMLDHCAAKIKHYNLVNQIQLQRCSFNNLEQLNAGTFDHIFSNFGGLNCAEDIETVIKQFDKVLNHGGIATLVIMPPICPWEMMLALKGNFKIAFRRLNKKGVPSHLEGVYFNTYYYSPKKIFKAFDKNKYTLLSIRGLGIFSPPPYLGKFPEQHPFIYKTLCKWEHAIENLRPFNGWADHFIISVKKKG